MPASARGMSASVVPTTTRAVFLPGRFTGKSIEGCVVRTGPLVRSDGGFAGGFGASATAEERGPSGRADTLGAALGSVV